VSDNCTVSVDDLPTTPRHAELNVRVIVAAIEISLGVAVAVPVTLQPAGPPTDTKLPAGSVNVSETCVPAITPVIVPVTTFGSLPIIVRTAVPLTFAPLCVAVHDSLSGSGSTELSTMVPVQAPERFIPVGLRDVGVVAPPELHAATRIAVTYSATVPNHRYAMALVSWSLVPDVI